VKPRKAKDIEATLLHKGFRVEETHHHVYWFFYNDRKTTIRTRLSHGVKEYGDNLLGRIKKQMHLANQELDQFFDCAMTGANYGELLIKRKLVKGAKER